ncbi:formin-like protein 3 isoform X3 [Amphibalanus amphitrite]|uniref:formin-like protein 3 isoform X3 n=1 Tax=Amphibalanus amphitrite TaxID=1232801 RepID=UPI001C901784|nr:formin-like protein 3 isoform X3 [Amphibalanus amphitrite]
MVIWERSQLIRSQSTWRRHGDQLRARTEAQQLPPTQQWPAAPAGGGGRREAGPYPESGRLPDPEYVTGDPRGARQSPARLVPPLDPAEPGAASGSGPDAESATLDPDSSARQPSLRLPAPSGSATVRRGPLAPASAPVVTGSGPAAPPTPDRRTADPLRRSCRVRKPPDFFQAVFQAGV